jgi:hypothetical protein
VQAMRFVAIDVSLDDALAVIKEGVIGTIVD